MSKIGKKAIQIPAGVSISAADGVVQVKGPRGALQYAGGANVRYEQQEGLVRVVKVADTRQARIDYGTARAHLQNMITGVTTGWRRALEINGVGYSAQLEGSKLQVNVGHSHEVKFEIPAGVTCKINRSTVELESNDRQQVGALAAAIRRSRPPEPYLGKGIKYQEEKIKRKAGKAAA